MSAGEAWKIEVEVHYENACPYIASFYYAPLGGAWRLLETKAFEEWGQIDKYMGQATWMLE